MEFYQKKVDEVLANLGTDINGLSKRAFDINYKKHGPNELSEPKKPSLISRFFAQFKNLMIIILLISSAVSIGLAITSHHSEDLIEGFTILAIVIVNAIIGVVQEKKADDSIAALKKNTIDYVKVRRNGVIKLLPSTELTLGDIVFVDAGDIVSADMRVIEAYSLYCDESMLTGESHAIEKHIEEINRQNIMLAEQTNMLFAGSVCVKGRGLGVVVRVGDNTNLGAIARTISQTEKNTTPLQKNIKKIGHVISVVVVAIVVVIFLMELLFAKNVNFVDALMMAIALAVAAIPESLPAVITIIMAMGVQTLARRKVIIRHLHAVETLGSCNVICSDKTGTITENKMKVVKTFSLGHSSDSTQNKINNISVLCSDVYKTEDGLMGDPTELALYNYVNTHNFDIENVLKNNKRVDERQFDSARKMMTVLVKNNNRLVSYTKGGCDRLLGKCNRALVDGIAVSLTKEMKEQIATELADMGDHALRVIGFAYREIDDYNQNTDIESDMIFVGMAGMQDPPRAEVKDAVARCKAAGMKAIMITGDHKNTAFAVARQVGIATNKSQVLTGEQIERMTDKELEKVVGQYTVFARVSPEHKVRIVSALKNLKQIVAMTGDGINDAASLKVADIGVGMGGTGSDVVKSVADMIVTDDNFASVVVAIEEGRKVYSNIQKSIQFLLSTNIVEVASIFLVLLFFPENTFLLPVQILFINLVTDSLPAFALGLEKIEPDAMTTPPRRADSNLFSNGIGRSIIYQGVIQTMIVMSVYLLGIYVWSAEVATTMVFFCIIFMQLLHSVNAKTNGSIFDTNLFANRAFNICFIVTLIINLSVAVIPFIGRALGIATLNWSQWIIVAVASLLIIPLVEVVKLLSVSIRLRKKV